MVNVFVYGTLRKNESNASLLKNAFCLAEQAWTEGVLFDTGFGYPAMTQSSTGYVFGELYKVTESELQSLDHLEGYSPGSTNNLYDRVKQTVYTDQGETMAYVYVAGRKDLLVKKISSGDWKEYRLINRDLKETVHYFAYGSCMDNKRFIEDGANHFFQKMKGVGILSNYTLRFTRKSSQDGMGRADIVEEGGIVEGKVYEIPIQALKDYLYRREGVPFAYRPTFVTVNLNGKMVEALTFVVKNKENETAPPDWYAEEILRGGSEVLSEEYIDRVREHIHMLKIRGR
ncbi:gamma-glutamylcyclotransferase [Calidifontibacillus erzurumensis]|uniref:Gamma-glutamylcyclotransferase n=1 Tax=Calidifontibacillus erzurumensis TaxID=2741433 RepID=A0A8J8GDH9_9BACI|nr:gamma-glutamylcyclotransferase family protein [Calidifontibacillus erzurumensis]NSL51859.1 gamma-glutamylcyclotransferase [Calidifontibacillus erzurumensis]